MSDGLCWASGGFGAAQELLDLLLRLLLAGAGLVVGWFVASPLVRLLYRLAFHRPVPPKVLTASRLAAAVVCGVLVFLLVDLLGPGGGGGGRGKGTGPGEGPGSLSGSDKGGQDAPGKGGKQTGIKPGLQGETFRIKLIASSQYKYDKRWYLIDLGGEPRTQAEVEAYLKGHKGRIKSLEIVLSSESPSASHYAVGSLRDLAAQYQLPVLVRDSDEDRKKSG
jgi:hypothetical protein